MASGVAVGIDVGGTKLAAGVVAADGSLLDRVRHDTPADAGGIVELLVAVVEELRGRHGVGHLPVGVGFAGLIDRQGVVRFAPNLPLADYPLAEELAPRLSHPVTLDNDANAAAWGEYRVGAGRDAVDSLVMLTIGTGVGGGLVLADRLVRGAGGMAGELGHIAVMAPGPSCPCGASGCLEALASGSAIARNARESLAAGRFGPDSPLTRLAPAQVTGKAVTLAAHDGDAEAVAILAEAGRWLGVGIASMIAAFDPAAIVLGGGAMQAGTLLLDPAVQAARDRLLGGGHREPAPIIQAALGDDAGLIGAALLALEDAGDAAS